jgi:peptide/nickel transport system ATP-binding protein
MLQIKELQRKLGFAVIFVTHDMSLVSHFSDQLLVMYGGQVVEAGPTRAVFDTPAHPYSRGLLDAFPSIRGPRVELTGIPGSPPDLAQPPSGCRFHPRCPVVMSDCSTVEPELYQVASRRASVRGGSQSEDFSRRASLRGGSQSEDFSAQSRCLRNAPGRASQLAAVEEVSS